MSLIATCYLKGAGGSTTIALGLAAVADEAMRAVLVECDPAGGDLTCRHGLAAGPGLVDLATAVRGDKPVGDVFEAVTQPLRLRDTTVPVVAAPPGGAQVRAALGELTGAGSPLLGAGPRLVVADCGRVTAGSVTWPLLAAADVVLVLVRAHSDEIAHLYEYLGELVNLGSGRLVVVLLRDGGVYPAGEVAEVLADRLVRDFAVGSSVLRVAGPVPQDRRAAAVLSGDLVAGRRWPRLPLPMMLRRLLDDVRPYLAAVTVPGARGAWAAP